jgi:hypothetical protein
MRWTYFILGLLIGSAGMFAAVRFAHDKIHSADDDQMVFAQKTFAQSPTWFTISGTMDTL